tara:strand:+ start:656 stop:805 length:150 start_codon:yes stop_codon:yes gene_type:complete
VYQSWEFDTPVRLYIVSKLAVKYGGGGHRRTAGFTCTMLPFKGEGYAER